MRFTQRRGLKFVILCPERRNCVQKNELCRNVVLLSSRKRLCHLQFQKKNKTGIETKRRQDVTVTATFSSPQHFLGFTKEASDSRFQKVLAYWDKQGMTNEEHENDVVWSTVLRCVGKSMKQHKKAQQNKWKDKQLCCTANGCQGMEKATGCLGGSPLCIKHTTTQGTSSTELPSAFQ